MNTATATRTLAFGLARVVLVLLGVAWIMSSAAAGLRTASPVDWSALAAALLANELCLVVFAMRMRLLVALYGVHLSFSDAFRIHLQSMFYFFIVPMTVGVEISRFAKIRAIDAERPGGDILTALLLDRIVGAAAAAALAASLLPFVRLRALEFGGIRAVVAALAGGAAAGAGLLMVPAVRRRLQPLAATAGRQWPMLAAAFLMSIVMHLLFAGGVHLGAEAIGFRTTYLEIVFAVTAGMLLIAVPVSLGGLGPAEVGVGAAALALGFAPGAAAILGGLPYLARLVAGLQGAAWEIVEGGRAAVAAWGAPEG